MSYIKSKYRQYDVVSIGDINVDIITPPTNAIVPETSSIVDNFILSIGGNAANFAIASSSLGLKTKLYGMLGEDAISKWIVEQLDGLGIDYSIKVNKDASAGITFALTFPDATRGFKATLGTNALVTHEDIDLKDILESKTKHLHRSGYWNCNNLRIGTKKIFKSAKNAGMETSLDVGWDNHPTEAWSKGRRERALDTLKYVDIFFGNEKELKKFTNKENIKEVANEIFSNGPKILVLHLGENGSRVITKDNDIFVPAFKIKVHNPTGSGDVFNAAFIYGIINGYHLEKAARFANATAAVKIRSEKAIHPKLNEVMSFMVGK